MTGVVVVAAAVVAVVVTSLVVVSVVLPGYQKHLAKIYLVSLYSIIQQRMTHNLIIVSYVSYKW